VKNPGLEEADPSFFDDGFATHHQETLLATSQLPPRGPLNADEPDLLGDRVRSAREGEEGNRGEDDLLKNRLLEGKSVNGEGVIIIGLVRGFLISVGSISDGI
jgi:hypothetical protein